MKNFVIGCLVILVLGAILLGTGGYFLYRAAAPLIEDARGYARSLGELGKLEANIKNTAPHVAPASGELTENQVQRFTRVQEHVRSALGQRMRQFEEKYRHLSSEGNKVEPSLRELLGGLGELANVFVDARRYQVDGLNKEGFSQDEYSWVRNRVFEAAGIEIASRIDLRKLEQAIRDGTGVEDFRTPQLPKPDVPAKNVELIKPLMKRFDEWLPLAFFGL